MIRAYYLYTGSDGKSHLERGSVSGSELMEAELSQGQPSQRDWGTLPRSPSDKSLGYIQPVPPGRNAPAIAGQSTAKYENESDSAGLS